MIKKLAAIVVLIIVVALVAGCTSSTNTSSPNKGVEITAHEGRTWQDTDGTYNKDLDVSIKNNGQDYFTLHPFDFTFYQKSNQVNAVSVSDPGGQTYIRGSDVTKLVKPGDTQVIEFSFDFSSPLTRALSSSSPFPDTLQYNDGTINEYVAI